MKSTFQMKKRPSTFCKQSKWGNSILKRYHPEKIFQLPSGLSIYKSWFKNSDSSRGVIGGPHEVFTRIESTYQAQTTYFLSNQYHMFKNGFQINPDTPQESQERLHA